MGVIEGIRIKLIRFLGGLDENEHRKQMREQLDGCEKFFNHYLETEKKVCPHNIGLVRDIYAPDASFFLVRSNATVIDSVVKEIIVAPWARKTVINRVQTLG